MPPGIIPGGFLTHRLKHKNEGTPLWRRLAMGFI